MVSIAWPRQQKRRFYNQHDYIICMVSTSSLVTLLRSWIRHFTMIISAWWLQTNRKFSEREFEVIHRNIGPPYTPKKERLLLARSSEDFPIAMLSGIY